MRKNLVAPRVGPSSMHRDWVEAGIERHRDLYLAPSAPIADEPDIDCTIGDVVPGPKWSGIREVLNAQVQTRPRP